MGKNYDMWVTIRDNDREPYTSEMGINYVPVKKIKVDSINLGSIKTGDSGIIEIEIVPKNRGGYVNDRE